MNLIHISASIACVLVTGVAAMSSHAVALATNLDTGSDAEVSQEAQAKKLHRREDLNGHLYAFDNAPNAQVWVVDRGYRRTVDRNLYEPYPRVFNKAGIEVDPTMAGALIDAEQPMPGDAYVEVQNTGTQPQYVMFPSSMVKRGISSENIRIKYHFADPNGAQGGASASDLAKWKTGALFK